MPDNSNPALKSESANLGIRKPRFCCIGISRKCILKCKMCSFWESNDSALAGEVTLNQWYNFIDQLAELTDQSAVINIAGGEPLLEAKNLELINYSTKKGLFTSMPTNGFLIDSQMAQRIAQSGLQEIEISLDSLNKDTHDFLRGVEGCFEKALQAIDYLDKYRGNLKIAIIAIILENNLDEIVRLAEFVNQDRRIETIIFQAVAQPFNTPLDNQWYKKSVYSFLWPQNLNKVSAVIDQLIGLKKSGYKISNSVSQFEVFKRYFANPDNFVKAACCNMDFYMNLNELGDVYMCLRKDPIGNIKKDTLKDIWYGPVAQKLRQEINGCSMNCHHLLNCCYEE